MTAITSLNERFPGLWPTHAPTSLLELCEMPLGDIRALADTHQWDSLSLNRVIDTRRDAIVASHSGAKVSLNSPATLRKMFDQGTLRAVANKWVTYALDHNRQRILTPTPAGELRYVYTVSEMVPDEAWLSRKAPLPDGGTWILLFGGAPDWVKDAAKARLETLVATGHVADVVYRHLRKGEPPVTYSTRAHCGTVGTTEVPWIG